MTELSLSSRVIAEHPFVEVAEDRDVSTRVWERTKEVEITHPDGRKETDIITSRVLEKGSGICYHDPMGRLVPSVPEWEITATAFAVERCVYRLYAGPTLATPLSYVVQGTELLFTPAALIASDGEREAIVATVNRDVMGRIDDDDRSRLVYVGAFGPGVDIEFAVEPAAIHQNVVIWREIGLPEGIDPATARLRVLTELDLDGYAEQGVGLCVGDKTVDLGAEELTTAASRHGAIRFVETVRDKEVALHSFVESPIRDAGGSAKTFFADRRLYRDPGTRKIYLEESIAYSELLGSRFPVVWDWVSAQNVPADEIDEWTPKDTVYVSSNISVYGTLIIRPGTTVKIASGKKIEVQSGGCVRAVGEPYNFITITSKNDDQSGEDLTPETTSGQAGDYQYALRLLQGSLASSAIQHCKIGYAETGIEDNVSLVSEIRDNVIRDVENYGVYLNGVSTNCRNNLLVDCGQDGVRCAGCSSCELGNNSIDSCGDGIDTSGSSGLVIKRNLLTRNAVGIRSQSDTDYTYDYNGFWSNTTADFVGVPENQQGVKKWPGGNPYEYSEIGSFFIDKSGYGSELSDGGANAQDALLTAEWYSVEAPTPKTGWKYSGETWEKHSVYSPTSGVYIGYHHSRVDYRAGAFFLDGTLTISPGVAVCLADWGYLHVGYNADLQCVGNPGGGGYVLFSGARPLSMKIESFAWPPPSAAGQNGIQAQNLDVTACQIDFTRFQWVYIGFALHEELDGKDLDHNAFSLCYRGIDLDAQIDLDAKSNLFAMNDSAIMMWGWTSRADRNVYNCTFNDNDCGVRFNDYDDLTMKDCLFTNNQYGAGRYHNYGGGSFVHDYNGFYNNTHDLYDEQTEEDMDLGYNAKELEESPYDPHGGYAERFYLIQHDNDLIDGGSRTATAAGLSTYTANLGSREDVGTSNVDIGYHYPLRLKPYLQNVQTDQITVMWHGSSNQTGYLEWGLTENYGELETDSPTQLETSGIWIYEKTLNGLAADTLYHYRVRHGSSYSPDSTFHTAMSTGDSFRFLAYGDNRGGTETPPQFRQEHFDVVNSMLAHAWADAEPRFVLHCADFVYDGGIPGQWQPHFFNPAAALLRNTPLWPSIGNHEYRGDGTAANYKELFCVPLLPKPNPREYWYSFDYGNCHFIVLDTKDDAPANYIGTGTDQHNWLLTDISSDEATGADWVIVLLHIPPYTDSSSHPYWSEDPNKQEVYRVRSYLAPIFEDPDHPADLVISGHNHFYERSQAGEGEEPEHWVHYIVTGGGGAPTHAPDDNNLKRVGYPDTGKACEAHHFCIIDIDGTTATLNVIKKDGEYIEQDVELVVGQEWEEP